MRRAGPFGRREAAPLGWLVAVAATVVLFLGPAAQAHPWQDWYVGRWSASAQTAGLWTFVDVSVATIEASRIYDGLKVWNDQPPTLWFNYKGLGSYSKSCSAPRNRNMVYWVASIDGPKLAQTFTCRYQSGEMNSFYMELDGSENFYKGGSGAVPSDQYDFFGTITHEGGHGTGGWTPNKHFTDVCPLNSTHATMCEFVIKGHTYSRSLATDDIHTFGGAY